MAACDQVACMMWPPCAAAPSTAACQAAMAAWGQIRVPPSRSACEPGLYTLSLAVS